MVNIALLMLLKVSGLGGWGWDVRLVSHVFQLQGFLNWPQVIQQNILKPKLSSDLILPFHSKK